MNVPNGERGFTVIEVLIAALVFSISSFAVFGVVRQLAATSILAAGVAQDDGTVDHLAAALSSDAATALAVYDPGDDACSGTSASTLSMYYKDNGGSTQTVVYRDSGGTVTRTSSAASTSASFANTSLSTHCLRASALVAQERLAADLPGVSVHDYPVNFGTDGSGNQQTGGNYVTIARIASTKTNSARELHLFAGSVPTGFTIIGPQWHAVVYREDHTRRFLFGLGQTSWLRIMAEVDVSYDNWRSRAVWCNFEALEVYGNQPTFNKDDVPVYAAARDISPAPTRVAVPDLYPETLLDYCRNHFNADPPGSPAGTWATPGPLPTPDDRVVSIPPWWVWQFCGPSMSCPAGTQPPATCDPLTPGSCSVSAPDVPPPGWGVWCAQWSPPNWGAPYFGSPCPAATPPPPPPPPPPPSPPPVNTTTTQNGTLAIFVQCSPDPGAGNDCAGGGGGDLQTFFLNGTAQVVASGGLDDGSFLGPGFSGSSLTFSIDGTALPDDGSALTVGPGSHVLSFQGSMSCSANCINFNGPVNGTWSMSVTGGS